MSLPDPALLNAPLRALAATTGAQGGLSDALPVAGLRLMADPAAQMEVHWSSPRDRLLDIASTVTRPGQWFALRLALDLRDLRGLAGLGFWLRSAAAPALVMQACLRSGTGDGHVDCLFERHILSHTAQSDHHALMLPDRTPALPLQADWREFLLFLPTSRPVTLALHSLHLFTVPA